MFFGMQHIRNGTTRGCCIELFELLDSLLLVQVVLIRVLNFFAGKVFAEEGKKIVFADSLPLHDGLIKGQKDAMHGGPVLHGGAGFAGNLPIAVELELERAGFVSLHRAGAETGTEIGGGWQRSPCRNTDRLGSGSSEDFGLKSASRALPQVCTKITVLNQLAQVAGWRGIGLAGSFFGVDGQRIASAGHGDIEQSTFLLLVESLLVFIRD